MRIIGWKNRLVYQDGNAGPLWLKAAVDVWLTDANVNGPIFRAIYTGGRIGTIRFSLKVIWGVVMARCSRCGLDCVARMI